MKKLLVVLVTIATVFTMVGCSGKEDSQLVVGMDCDYAPYSWTTTEANKSEHSVKINNENAWCDGYDVQIAQHIADELGKELVIQKMPFEGLTQALSLGNIDIILAGMTPTEDRKAKVDFSDSYFVEEDDTEIVIVTTTDGRIKDAKTLNDFNGAKIIAQMGTFHIGLISQMTGVVEGTHLQDFVAITTQLKGGTIDGYLAEMAVAQQHIASQTGLKIISLNPTFDLPDESSDICAAVKKGETELLNGVNEALKKVSAQTRADWMAASGARAQS